jgi:hypothetical protein
MKLHINWIYNLLQKYTKQVKSVLFQDYGPIVEKPADTGVLESYADRTVCPWYGGHAYQTGPDEVQSLVLQVEGWV